MRPNVPSTHLPQKADTGWIDQSHAPGSWQCQAEPAGPGGELIKNSSMVGMEFLSP